MDHLNDAMKQHLRECGIIAVGHELVLWTSEGHQFTMPLPSDLWSPIPVEGEEWVEDVNWSCGIDEILVLYYRRQVPVNTEFYVAVERLLEFVDVRVVYSAARFIHDFVTREDKPTGRIKIYMVSATNVPEEWLATNPDLTDNFVED